MPGGIMMPVDITYQDHHGIPANNIIHHLIIYSLTMPWGIMMPVDITYQDHHGIPANNITHDLILNSLIVLLGNIQWIQDDASFGHH